MVFTVFSSGDEQEEDDFHILRSIIGIAEPISCRILTPTWLSQSWSCILSMQQHTTKYQGMIRDVMNINIRSRIIDASLEGFLFQMVRWKFCYSWQKYNMVEEEFRKQVICKRTVGKNKSR